MILSNLRRIGRFTEKSGSFESFVRCFLLFRFSLWNWILTCSRIGFSDSRSSQGRHAPQNSIWNPGT